MLTIAKYYASALFLTAVIFIAAIDSPEALLAMLSNLAADNPDHIANAWLLVRTWFNFSAFLALFGIGLRLALPWSLPKVGRQFAKDLPGCRSREAD